MPIQLSVKELDEAKRFIQLAGQMGCPTVRVFPNNFQKIRKKIKPWISS